MTKGLVKSSLTLTKLYNKSNKKPKTDDAYLRYTEFRNLYNQLKRTAKQLHYKQRFEQYKNDIKGTWKMLSSLLGKTNDKSHAANTFKYNNEILSTPTDIANRFCEYFTEVGPSLAHNIPAPTNDYYNIKSH
jgi:hypothetical protein